MGWNAGYTIMEHTVITLYDRHLLTKEILEAVMEPYKGTNCDSGGSCNLKAKDGLGVEEIIRKTMCPQKYQDVIDHPKYYKNEPERWQSNEKAYDLFHKIWHVHWDIF